MLLLAAALWSIAPGTAFVSSHPLCTGPEPLLSPAVSLLSLRRRELEAKLNRWAAVSQEWNFSPIGLRKVGGEEGMGGGGGLLTKRLSLVSDKLLESHWDEATTQVMGERVKVRTRSPSLTVTKELLFYRCGRLLFFLKDAGKPWNRSLLHTNRKPFTKCLHTNMEWREEREKKTEIWPPAILRNSSPVALYTWEDRRKVDLATFQFTQMKHQLCLRTISNVSWDNF